MIITNGGYDNVSTTAEYIYRSINYIEALKTHLALPNRTVC